ncbi:UNVERIFIED_CONTAM: hypothetical protein GTU68_029183 [Idotea baltica]|nr:hypothetical protein [Idotea baltica]
MGKPKEESNILENAPARIFLGLGSNIGNRLLHLEEAIAGLQKGGFTVTAQSASYETPPWGLKEQPSFLNQVIEGRYAGTAIELLTLAMQVETQAGRERLVHWGPRVLDIDILAFGQEVVASQRLTVPHPFAQQRAFVLIPWAEIAPHFILPGQADSIVKLMEALPPEDLASIEKIGR